MHTPVTHMVSAVQGVRWPGLFTGDEASILALQFYFEQSQWWTADELFAHQLDQLQLLLRHAYETVPYYRRVFTDAGYSVPDRLTQDDWYRIAILKRADVQSAGESLYSNRIPGNHGKLSIVHSSGSTGRPVTVRKTALCRVFWDSFIIRDHHWHRRDLGGKLASVRYLDEKKYPPGKMVRQKGWGMPTGNLYRTGESVLLHSSTDIETQAQCLVCENPDSLLTYPSNMVALARHFLSEGLTLPRLQQVNTFGESLDSEQRKACCEAWGVQVIDTYSSEETGYIALQCPEHEHYHIQSEGILVEILDDQNRPCSPGETGRVVVTPLHNFATPLIRYEIGDYAEVGKPCGCGRGLPVLKRILGRSRNMLRLPDGTIRRPTVGIRDYGKVAPVLQAQLVQHSLEHVEARLVVGESLLPQQEEALKEMIRHSLGHPFHISLAYHDRLERGPRDKFEDFISKVTGTG